MPSAHQMHCCHAGFAHAREKCVKRLNKQTKNSTGTSRNTPVPCTMHRAGSCSGQTLTITKVVHSNSTITTNVDHAGVLASSRSSTSKRRKRTNLLCTC